MRPLELDRRSGLEPHHLKPQSRVSSDVNTPRCVYCQSERFEELLDLGAQPLANHLLEKKDQPEIYYPLRLVRCKDCSLIQRETSFEIPIFDVSYPYRSSVNQGYVKQTKVWAERFIWTGKNVLEIGCNDGFLVNHLREKGAISWGIDPSTKGQFIFSEFFSKGWAEREKASYDVIIANNVLAHTPKLKDLCEGMALAVRSDGFISIEFPDFENLYGRLDVDTIYHEHFSYFTLSQLINLMGTHQLECVMTEKIPSHGGSIRAIFCKKPGVQSEAKETLKIKPSQFRKDVMTRKFWLSRHVTNLASSYRDLIAFGAAAKGISMLNWLGVKSDMIRVCIDETKEKQGKFMPGSRIPILGMDYITRAKPSFILILPWNFEEEIRAKLKFTEEWGCRIEVMRHA